MVTVDKQIGAWGDALFVKSKTVMMYRGPFTGLVLDFNPWNKFARDELGNDTGTISNSDYGFVMSVDYGCGAIYIRPGQEITLGYDGDGLPIQRNGPVNVTLTYADPAGVSSGAVYRKRLILYVLENGERFTYQPLKPETKPTTYSWTISTYSNVLPGTLYLDPPDTLFPLIRNPKIDMFENLDIYITSSTIARTFRLKIGHYAQAIDLAVSANYSAILTFGHARPTSVSGSYSYGTGAGTQALLISIPIIPTWEMNLTPMTADVGGTIISATAKFRRGAEVDNLDV